MDKRLAYLISVVLFLGALAVSEQPAWASLGPVHHYTFRDGTAQDSAGNADGTLKGDAQIVGGALVLSGNGWMEMPGSLIAINTFHEVSLATWFISNTMGKTGRYMLACFGEAGSGTDGKYLFMTPTWTDGKPRAGMGSSGVSAPAKCSENEVHCMVCTVDAMQLKLYIDGVQVGSVILPSGKGVGGIGQAYAYLGKSVVAGDPPWIGTIREFAIYDRALSASEIKSNCIPVGPGAPGPADNPHPRDDEIVTGSVTLSWTPGQGAQTQDLYFGSNCSDVNAASRTNPMGVLASQAIDVNSFHLTGLLQLGQTYCWRVDSVGSTGLTTKGHVWSFTVGYPFCGLLHIPLGSAKLSAGAGGTLVVSNLGSTGQDGVEVLLPEGTEGFDADWVDLGDPNALPEGASLKWTVKGMVDGGERSIAVLKGEVSKGSMTAEVEFPALAPKSIVADFYYQGRLVHSEPFGPDAKFGFGWSTRIPNDFHVSRQPWPPGFHIDLTWCALRGTTLMTSGGRVLPQVDEIRFEPEGYISHVQWLTQILTQLRHIPYVEFRGEDTDANDTSCSCVFTLDDFESYNDTTNKIFDTWNDGQVNGSGATVGNPNPPFVEQTIVHCGKQSMPFSYDNSTGVGYSETQRQWPKPVSWVLEDVNCLSLWFYGDPCNAPSRLYVALEDTAGHAMKVFHGDPAAITVATWQQWTIPLSAFSAVDLKSLARMAIGLDDTKYPKLGGKGKIYLDDICLNSCPEAGGGAPCQCKSADTPITPIKATASSSSDASTGPEKTIDGSGLNASWQHSTAPSDMWLSGKNDPGPIWILYEFDCVYKLRAMWVWNYNALIEAFIGFGAKDVVIECSIDGSTWTLIGSFQFAQATGQPTYVHNTTIGLGDMPAKYVRLTIKSTWGGLVNQAGLSEVRFLCAP